MQPGWKRKRGKNTLQKTFCPFLIKQKNKLVVLKALEGPVVMSQGGCRYLVGTYPCQVFVLPFETTFQTCGSKFF